MNCLFLPKCCTIVLSKLYLFPPPSMVSSHLSSLLQRFSQKAGGILLCASLNNGCVCPCLRPFAPVSSIPRLDAWYNSFGFSGTKFARFNTSSQSILSHQLLTYASLPVIP